MRPWGQVLGAGRVRSVAAFVLSLKGQNLQGRPPQGTAVEVACRKISRATSRPAARLARRRSAPTGGGWPSTPSMCAASSSERAGWRSARSSPATSPRPSRGSAATPWFTWTWPVADSSSSGRPSTPDISILAFLAAALVFSLLFVTAWRGRVWCGWACPQTVFLEALYRPIERLLDGPRAQRMKLATAPFSLVRLTPAGFEPAFMP